MTQTERSFPFTSRKPVSGLALPLLALCLAWVWSVSGPSGRQARTVKSQAIGPVHAACDGDNPYFATTRIYMHMVDHIHADYWAVVALKDTSDDVARFRYPDNPEQVGLVRNRDIGAVHGLAYDWRRNELYAAAVHNAFAGFGPGGPGGVYKIDMASGSVDAVLTLDAGPNVHESAVDRSSGGMIGKIGLGDIEIDPDASRLFVMNLHDRGIHVFTLPDLRAVGTIETGGRGQDWHARARPFGLGIYGDWLFHGLVDSQEGQGSLAVPAAYVYRSRLDGSQMSLVASFELDYMDPPRWTAWQDRSAQVDGIYVERQPILMDIEFRPDGRPIIGLGSRTAGMGIQTYNVGDVLATRALDPGRWSVVVDRESYLDDLPFPYAGRTVEESNFGALARFPGLDRVVSTGAFWSSGQGRIAIGLKWYDNQSGELRGPADGGEIVTADLPTLGDIESLCAPDPTPTPSPTPSPSRTPTRTSSPTPTPRRTASASPTATTTPLPIYLPLIAQNPCLRRERRADVVLAIDLSTSMLRRSSTGRKLDEALSAARRFVDVLELDAGQPERGDRVAIVGFNDRAWIALASSGQAAQVETALLGLESSVAEGTRLDSALEESQRAIEAAPRAGRQAVLVLLTDGLPNRVPFGPGTEHPECPNQECTILEIAGRLERAGTRRFTIGLGAPDDRLTRLLVALASRPEDCFLAPSGEDLLEIYRSIAGRIIDCPR